MQETGEHHPWGRQSVGVSADGMLVGVTKEDEGAKCVP